MGLQAGYVQKSVDFTKFYFDNQCADAGFDTGLPANENFEAQSLDYLDVNAGISYAYTGSAKFSFYSGLALITSTSPMNPFTVMLITGLECGLSSTLEPLYG